MIVETVNTNAQAEPERVVWKFGDVGCLLRDGEYRTFTVDKQTGMRQEGLDSTRHPGEAWDWFWRSVNAQMKERIERRMRESRSSLWLDPGQKSPYITNIQAGIIRSEYKERSFQLNGRYDCILTEDQRMVFEADMLEKYAQKYPIPPELHWRAEGIKIQAGIVKSGGQLATQKEEIRP